MAAEGGRVSHAGAATHTWYTEQTTGFLRCHLCDKRVRRENVNFMNQCPSPYAPLMYRAQHLEQQRQGECPVIES